MTTFWGILVVLEIKGQCAAAAAAARVPDTAQHVVGGTGEGWPRARSSTAFPPTAWLSFALVGVLYGRAMIRDNEFGMNN
ncbi:hypothetical protein NHJ13734_002674 [Beauveria thailandica]